MEKRRLGIGAVLAGCGALGIVLGPVMGLTDLVYPWSFLAGFATGIVSGLGAVLGISGLLGLRCARDDRSRGGWR